METRNRADDTGFTLIELIIVVVVIAVLAAIAIPLYNNFQEDAKQTAVEESVRALEPALFLHETETANVQEYNNSLMDWMTSNVDMDGEIRYQVIQTPGGTGAAIGSSKNCIEAAWRDDPDISAVVGGGCQPNELVIHSCSTSGNTITAQFAYTGAEIGYIRVAGRGPGDFHNDEIEPGATSYSHQFALIDGAELVLTPTLANGQRAAPAVSCS